MSAETNKAIYRRIMDEIANKGNLAFAEEVYAEEYVYRTPGEPDVHGIDGALEVFALYRSAFPDLHVEIKSVIADGDKLAAHYTATGTHRGDLKGIPPTGRRVSIDVLDLLTFRDGKVVEELEIGDNLALLQQLGVVPETLRA